MNENICIFIDFEGTITKSDDLNNIVCNLYSTLIFKKYENLLIENIITYETYMDRLFSNKRILDLVDERNVDPTFKDFYDVIVSSQIPIFILSNGFKSFIEKAIPYVEKEIIFANDITEDGKITLYHKQQSLDKKLILHNFKLRNPMFKIIYIGDGINDFDVIECVDFIFAKKNSLFHKKLESMRFPFFKTFQNLTDIFSLSSIGQI